MVWVGARGGGGGWGGGGGGGGGNWKGAFFSSFSPSVVSTPNALGGGEGGQPHLVPPALPPGCPSRPRFSASCVPLTQSVASKAATVQRGLWGVGFQLYARPLFLLAACVGLTCLASGDVSFSVFCFLPPFWPWPFKCRTTGMLVIPIVTALPFVSVSPSIASATVWCITLHAFSLVRVLVPFNLESVDCDVVGSVAAVLPSCSQFSDNCTSCAGKDNCAWCASTNTCLTVSEIFSSNCRGTVFDLPCPDSFVGGRRRGVGGSEVVPP